MQAANIKQFMQSLTLFMYNLYSFAMPLFQNAKLIAVVSIF